jgi:hypothetical protein
LIQDSFHIYKIAAKKTVIQTKKILLIFLLHLFLISCHINPFAKPIVCEAVPVDKVVIAIDSGHSFDFDIFQVNDSFDARGLYLLREQQKKLSMHDLFIFASSLGFYVDSTGIVLHNLVLYTDYSADDTLIVSNKDIHGALLYYSVDGKLYCYPFVRADKAYMPIEQLHVRVDGTFTKDFISALNLFDGYGQEVNMIVISSTEKPIKRPRWIRRFLSDKTDSYLAKKAD